MWPAVSYDNKLTKIKKGWFGAVNELQAKKAWYGAVNETHFGQNAWFGAVNELHFSTSIKCYLQTH